MQWPEKTEYTTKKLQVSWQASTPTPTQSNAELLQIPFFSGSLPQTSCAIPKRQASCPAINLPAQVLPSSGSTFNLHKCACKIISNCGPFSDQGLSSLSPAATICFKRSYHAKNLSHRPTPTNSPAKLTKAPPQRL